MSRPYAVEVTVSIRCGSEGTRMVILGSDGAAFEGPPELITIEEAATLLGNWIALVSTAERAAILTRQDRPIVIDATWAGHTPRAFLT